MAGNQNSIDTILSGIATAMPDNKEFVGVLRSYLDRLSKVYSDEIVGYGASKDIGKRDAKDALSRIQGHFGSLEDSVKDAYPVETSIDIYAFIDLNEALTKFAVKNEGLDEKARLFLVRYTEMFRFGIPFEIEKRNENGIHAGKRSGYYNVTLNIPQESGYRSVKAFVKIFKGTEAMEREKLMHKKCEEARINRVGVLFDYVGDNYSVMLFEYADDNFMRSLFGEELDIHLKNGI